MITFILSTLGIVLLLVIFVVLYNGFKERYGKKEEKEFYRDKNLRYRRKWRRFKSWFSN